MKGMTELAAAIRQQRGTDTVIVFASAADFWPATPAKLDEFMKEAGLSGIGACWREILREAAVDLASYILACDLAYKTRIMSDVEARELAERFVGAFGADPRFFTNTDDPTGESRSWAALTGSTFDAGLVGIDANAIGVVVVQDED